MRAHLRKPAAFSAPLLAAGLSSNGLFARDDALPDYSIHLHDPDWVPPRSTHISATDDEAAKAWALQWLKAAPEYGAVTVVEGLRLIGKYLRSQIP
ncbi:MAG: hypothetical protein EBR82_26930 [Caulobacteraceae bacterium]|nr:hypothetical protein [Caulobacteraceae bacterium]